MLKYRNRKISDPFKNIFNVTNEETDLYGFYLLKHYKNNNLERIQKIESERKYSNYYFIKRLDVFENTLINKTTFDINKNIIMLYVNMKKYLELLNINYKILLERINDILTRKVEESRNIIVRIEEIISLFSDPSIIINPLNGFPIEKLILQNIPVGLFEIDKVDNNEISTRNLFNFVSKLNEMYTDDKRNLNIEISIKNDIGNDIDNDNLFNPMLNQMNTQEIIPDIEINDELNNGTLTINNNVIDVDVIDVDKMDEDNKMNMENGYEN